MLRQSSGIEKASRNIPSFNLPSITELAVNWAVLKLYPDDHIPAPTMDYGGGKYSNLGWLRFRHATIPWEPSFVANLKSLRHVKLPKPTHLCICSDLPRRLEQFTTYVHVPDERSIALSAICGPEEVENPEGSYASLLPRDRVLGHRHARRTGRWELPEHVSGHTADNTMVTLQLQWDANKLDDTGWSRKSYFRVEQTVEDLSNVFGGSLVMSPFLNGVVLTVPADL
ncbi:hypothetical protein BD413DRAFT_492144 [Trametes elegans]|nr:hypothetical protein BD413DRAFT_492144 [Trametes elegans]